MDRRVAPGGGGARRAVRFRTGMRNTILEVLSSRDGWVETDAELDWDIHWADTARPGTYCPPRRVIDSRL